MGTRQSPSLQVDTVVICEPIRSWHYRHSSVVSWWKFHITNNWRNYLLGDICSSCMFLILDSRPVIFSDLLRAVKTNIFLSCPIWIHGMKKKTFFEAIWIFWICWLIASLRRLLVISTGDHLKRPHQRSPLLTRPPRGFFVDPPRKLMWPRCGEPLGETNSLRFAISVAWHMFF